MAEWRNKSLVVKDRFQDWGLFHKSVVIFFVILFSAALARGVFVVEGGTYLIKAEQVFSFDPEQINPWIVESENRVRWQAEVTDFLKYSGDERKVGSTRRVDHRRDGEEWVSFEQTTEIEPNKLYKTVQADEVKLEDRSFEVTMQSVNSCQTKVVIKEIIFPRRYFDRYWAFLDKSQRQKRLKVSLNALDRWLQTSKTKCE